MTFRKTVIIRLLVIFAMLLFYAASVFVDSASRPGRDSAYTWLGRQFLEMADRIELSGSSGNITLLRVNTVWVAAGADGAFLPANTARVESLLSILSTRGNYPVRTMSRANAALAGFYDTGGNNAGAASSIVVRGGAGFPLLDLQIGFAGPLGQEVFLRKAGYTEIRSGTDQFTVYTESGSAFWYDLRLFPNIDAADIQGIAFASGGTQSAVRRSRTGWAFLSTGAAFPDGDSFLRSLLSLSGENFLYLETLPAIHERVTLEQGDGSLFTLNLGPPDSNGYQPAWVSGSGLVYLVSKWTAGRLRLSFPQ